MRIVIFTSEKDGVIARIKMMMPGKGGRRVMSYNPVVIHAPTSEEATATAQKFYDDEMARLNKGARQAKADGEEA